MNNNIRCRNLNHGKSNPPVAFCPNCGEKFKTDKPRRTCNDSKHREWLKAGSTFCVDCGKKIKA